jgi:hypothetical protein
MRLSVIKDTEKGRRKKGIKREGKSGRNVEGKRT